MCVNVVGKKSIEKNDKIKKTFNRKKLYNIYETKISNSLIALFVTAFSSSSSRYFLSHVGLGSPFTPSLYKRHYMLPMKIYPYLSYRREINETDVNYTCNLQKVWDSSDSLNGNSCSLFHVYSIYNSNDQWRFFNTMECHHREKGKGKVQFLGISYFWIEVLV